MASTNSLARYRPLSGNTLSGSLLTTLSQSSGSIVVDGAIGATAGYLSAPEIKDQWNYALAGAVVTGVAGLLGLFGILGYSYAARRRR